MLYLSRDDKGKPDCEKVTLWPKRPTKVAGKWIWPLSHSSGRPRKQSDAEVWGAGYWPIEYWLSVCTVEPEYGELIAITRLTFAEMLRF